MSILKSLHKSILAGVLGLAISLVTVQYVSAQTFFGSFWKNRGNVIVWTGGGGDANWTTVTNWSPNLVPGPSHVARFTGPACSTNCSPTIDANVNVSGIDMQATYAGTITQSTTLTVTVGTEGWIQAGGTFTGGDSNITINNILTLSGGTFTATSAQTLITSGFNYTAGTFNHSNGLLRFDNGSIVAGNSTVNITLPGAVTLYDLQYSGGYNSSTANYTVNITAGSLNVLNQLRIGRTVAGALGSVKASGGTINLKGNLVADPSGSFTTYTPTNLVMDGSGAQTYDSTSGLVPNLTINKSSGTVTPTGGTTNITTHSFTLTQGNFTAPSGTFSIAGNFTIASGTTYGHGGGSLTFANFNYGGTQAYSISLPSALQTANLTFGGGISGSVSTTTWTIAGSTPTINATGNLSVANSNGGTGNIIVNGGNVNVAGNVTAGAYTAGNSTITLNGTGAQTYTKSGAGGTFGGAIIVNKASGTAALATAASFSTASQTLTVTAGTLNMAGFALTVNSALSVAVGAKLLCNGGTLTAGSYSILGEVACGPTTGITWTGAAADNLWTTAGNWTNNTIPTASDIALFNSSCSGANCNATMAAALTIKGLSMYSSYVGTITQGTTVTIGTSGWTQAGGTFAGGASAITNNGHFALSGGTFTSTSGTWTNYGTVNYTISGAPTYNHNSGTLVFSGPEPSAQTITPENAVHNNVTFAGDTVTYTISGTMIVNGTLGLADVDSTPASLNGGTISARGDINVTNYGKPGTTLIQVSGTGNQTVTGVANGRIPALEIISTGGTVTLAGTLLVRSHYTYTSGVVDPGTSTLHFSAQTTTNTVTPGTVTYNNVTFGGDELNINLVGTMTVNGLLTLADTDSGPGTLNTGTIEAKGDVSFASYGKPGTALVKISGSGNQTITGAAAAYTPRLQIISTGGTVTYAGTWLVSNDFTHTSGTVNAGSSTLRFYNYNTTTTLVAGSAEYNNVTFYGYRSTFTLNDTMNALGTLTLGDSSSGGARHINTGTLNALGDVLFNDNGYTGTAQMILAGANSTTYRQTGTISILSGAVTVNKSAPSTTVLLMANTLLNNAGQTLTVTSGTVDMAGNNLTVNDALMIAASGIVTCRGGTLSHGSISNSGTLDCTPTSIYWSGAGGNTNWSTAGNWSGGVVPGVNDTAIFSNAYCGLNCAATVNVDPGVKGIRFNSDFTGTVTQAPGVAITVGELGWYQVAGTFAGGNSAHTINGNFVLNGGSYTASSGTTNLIKSFSVAGAPTFNANLGTFQFGGSSSVIISPGALVFNNVTLSGTNTNFGLTAGTLAVDGNLSLGDSTSASGGVNNGTINVGGNLTYTGFGYTGTASMNLVGNASVVITVAGGATLLPTNLTITKPSSATVTMASDLSLNASNQQLNITSGILDVDGHVLTVNDALTVGTLGSLLCNGGSYTSGSLANSGFVNCGGYAFNWTGAGGNTNWNTAGNWSGGVAPGSGNIVIFSDANCGATCNATINVPASVKGVVMLADYTGTITQNAGQTITVTTNGWSQSAGTFNGSDSAMTLSGPFTLAGGTFTAPSSTITTTSSWFVTGSPTFTHNGGTLVLTTVSGEWKQIIPGTVTYGHLRLEGSSTGGALQFNAGTMTVANTFISNNNAQQGWFNGTIDVKGNITMNTGTSLGSAIVKVGGSTNQTVTGVAAGYTPNLEIASTGGTVSMVGTIKVPVGFIYTSGTVDWGTSLLHLEVNPNTNVTIVPGALVFKDVQFSGSSTAKFFNLSGGTMTISGALNLNTTCSNGIQNGIIRATGDVAANNLSYGGNATLKIAGSGNQTLTGAGAAQIPNLEFASTGGTVSVVGTLNVFRSLVYTSGTINWGSSNLLLNTAGSGTHIYITPGTITYQNVTFQGGGTGTTFNFNGGTMTTAGTTTIAGGGTGGMVNGTLNPTGNLTMTSGSGGDAQLLFTGSATQTISATGGTRPTGARTVNKTGGSIVQSSALSFTGTNPITITAGTWDMAGFALTTTGAIANSGTLKRGNNPSCGTLTSGSYTGNAAICP